MNPVSVHGPKTKHTNHLTQVDWNPGRIWFRDKFKTNFNDDFSDNFSTRGTDYKFGNVSSY